MKARLCDMTNHLANVELLDLQPARVLCQLLSTADIHLLPQRPEVNDSVLPGRLAAMLASGRPVVAMANGGTQLHAELNGAGYVVSPGDINAFVDAIVKLNDDPDLRKRLGAKGRELAETRWDQSAILARVELRLQELSKHRTVSRPAYQHAHSGQHQRFKGTSAQEVALVNVAELQSADGEAS